MTQSRSDFSLNIFGNLLKGCVICNCVFARPFFEIPSIFITKTKLSKVFLTGFDRSIATGSRRVDSGQTTSLVFHEDSKNTIPSTSAVSVFPNILQNFGQNFNQIIKTESLKTRIFCLNQGAFKEQSSRKSQNEFKKKARCQAQSLS